MTTDHRRSLDRIRGSHPLRGRESTRALLHRPMLQPADLVMPLLVVDESIDPTVEQLVPTYTFESAVEEASHLGELGIRGVKIFASCATKDRTGSETRNDDGLLLRCVRAIRAAAPNLCLITETCLCSYTDHGNCVVVDNDGHADLDATSTAIADFAVRQAQAGVDVVGPAAMLNGSVRATRDALNAAGFANVGVMPHLIFTSSLYDVYRRTMRAAPASGLRSAFQIDPSLPQQATDQALSYLDEGADMLLLQPALFELDVLVQLRKLVDCPIAPFSVSGEYALLRPAGLPATLEFASSLKRAGADFIVTYSAKELAASLAAQNYCPWLPPREVEENGTGSTSVAST